MLRVVVLGAAAGGGIPQWNCGCQVCRKARSENHELRSTQASIAVSADGAHWYLINASPDLRQQLIATPQLHPKAGQLRHSPIAGVILTNGEVDAVAGLLSMREGSPFTLYAHERVLAILRSNSIFNVLGENNVKRQPIEPDKAFYPAEDYHQDFLTRNPTYPYIVFNDLPKIEDLKRLFSDRYRADPVLVAAARPAKN